MKKLWILCGLVCVVILLSCAIRRSEPVTGKSFTVTDARVQHGEEVFMAKCQKCHPGGEGGLGPSINGLPGFAKKFQTRHGFGVMPAFKSHDISKSDLKDVMLFLRKWNNYG